MIESVLVSVIVALLAVATLSTVYKQSKLMPQRIPVRNHRQMRRR